MRGEEGESGDLTSECQQSCSFLFFFFALPYSLVFSFPFLPFESHLFFFFFFSFLSDKIIRQK